ncbi:MAG: 50S ribosomal protein L33 [candidate division WOR-3 bacterium]
MRVKVVLVCQECKRRNYIATRHRDKKQKIEIRKYCKWDKRHTLHKEAKL